MDPYQPMDPTTDAAMANGGNRPGQGNTGAQQDAQARLHAMMAQMGINTPAFYQGGATPGSMQIQLGQNAQSQFGGGLNAGASAAQQNLLQQLQNQAAGRGPSLADQQMHSAMAAQSQQQAAMAAASRNPALAQYNAAMGAAGGNAQIASGATQARLAEQLQAQQGLAGLAGQMQGQSLQNAGMGLQNNQFNAGAQNQFGLAQGQINQGQNQLYNQMMSQQYGAQQQYNYQSALQKQQNDAENSRSLTNGLIQGGTSLAGAGLTALSDAREKQDIRPGAPLVRDMLDQLRAHDYEYKSASAPGAGPGRHVSPMAQELEKSELGRRLVQERNGMKMVDYGKAAPALLAALADMNQRMKQIEKKKGS